MGGILGQLEVYSSSYSMLNSANIIVQLSGHVIIMVLFDGTVARKSM